MRRKPHSPRLYTKKTELMKKSYIAPQTEAIELLGANAIMVASPGGLPINGNPNNGVFGN